MNADDASAAGASGQGVSGQAVSVRPAVAADAEQMHRLAQAAYGHYVPRLGRSPAPMTADYARVVSSEHGWVTEQQGRLVGMLVLEPHPDHLLLGNVAVDPDRQGAGVGGHLLAFAAGQARLFGLPEVRLFTNAAMTENLEYYLRRGSRQTHRAEQDGYQRVFFSKQLHNTDQ